MKEKSNDKFLDQLKELIVSIVIAFVVVIVVTQFIFIPVKVVGPSMEPTLHNKNLGFSNVFKMKTSEIERFDIVVIEVKEQHKNLVKRVIGLPGDTIYYERDRLYVNGQVVEEPFLDPEFMEEQKILKGSQLFTLKMETPVLVPEGEYFVMGDNRLNSSDSRDSDYGTFKKSDFRSKSIYVYYPFNEMRKEGK